jgi:hypothetical protein
MLDAGWTMVVLVVLVVVEEEIGRGGDRVLRLAGKK